MPENPEKIEYKKAERFFWFGAESLAEWKEYLDAGADRVEFHEHDGKMFASFFKDGAHQGTVDESHLCPTDCG